MSNRTISKNINIALEVLSACQYVLGLVAKVKLYVEQKRFYPAIKVSLEREAVYIKGNFNMSVINSRKYKQKFNTKSTDEFTDKDIGPIATSPLRIHSPIRIRQVFGEKNSVN